MSYALCELGKLSCAHGGTVTLTGLGSATLKGGGSPVLTKTGLTGASIVGCTNNPPDTTVSTITGESTTLTSGGSGAIVGTTTIQTNNVASMVIVPGQAKLTG